MTSQDETKSITMEFDLAHPPAKVWRALTEPALLAKWLMATNLKPAVGETFTFSMEVPPGGGWDGVVHCQMKELEPQKRLGYTWNGGGLETRVTWTLSPTPKGTLLRLEQTGFSGEKSAQKYYEGAKWGWQTMAGQKLPAVLDQI
jgi:uncharacterized protein YndB with AHSA1/START domain